MIGTACEFLLHNPGLTNRDLEEHVKKGEEMLRVDIEKMPSFNIGLERGIKEGIQKGIEKGMQKGIEKGIVLVAKKMLKANMDLENISKITNLTIEQLKKLHEEDKD